jgi:hypothetical protein
MGSTTLKKVDCVSPVLRVRTTSAAPLLAVRSRAHAGTPVASTGELRLVTTATATDTDVRFPGTAVPGGPPA